LIPIARDAWHSEQCTNASNQVLISAEELGRQAETLRSDVDSFLANIRAA